MVKPYEKRCSVYDITAFRMQCMADEIQELRANNARYMFLRDRFATKSEHSVDDFIALEPMTGDYFDAHIDILMAEFTEEPV